METLAHQIRPQTQPKPQCMNPLISKLRPTNLSSSLHRLKPLCTLTNSPALTSPKTTKKPSRSSTTNGGTVKTKPFITKGAEAAQLKLDWLESLTCPLPDNGSTEKGLNAGGFVGEGDLVRCNAGSSWVVGVDPDTSGALALLNLDGGGCSARVFDAPHLKIMVGNRTRKRLDVKSMVQLLRSFDIPIGTTAYIEQSIPFPKDGKQGWWSGGFNYGLWIGVLVASGFSVIPVPSSTWKNEFEYSGAKNMKDDSRRIASEIFPALSSLLNRKKDHGRAEALLIAAYGKDHKAKSASSSVLEELPLN
ncbi:hypothetical protein Tsubulata_007854 [Turnera subulata]|uniref:Uncharacterized protein n=1 Tax=Turnera subulata TaxID=218843 RepID=A0A9Q0GGD3_9ROSI|nr:hypothetical protein Tsubulata_007854 [Turnera subulata]